MAKYASNGKIDLGNKDALIEYNKAIAWILLDLKFTVPSNFLIPTICLRYNYLDILIRRFQPRHILEIGTGSTAILAMIAAKKYQIPVTATEINTESLNWARKNIELNAVDHLITLIQSTGGIINGVIPKDAYFDMLVCYPPMYPQEDRKNFEDQRKERGFQGVPSEMVGGGKDGFDFIAHLIEEVIVSGQVGIITILNIKRTHADQCMERLQEAQISAEMIELLAGNRKRYIVIGYIGISRSDP
ncbi:MAG: RlmF-related methyltransferase [Candidatus Heimdallarchaeota archaeon]|nr:RlmF-related methyltransferase [Candidatus Heimdallarchaeota archaeon]